MIELYGIVFSIFLGTIGFFIYTFTNKNSLLGLFFYRKNTIYDVLKCGYTSILMYSIVENLKLIHNEHVLAIKGLSLIFFTLLLIPVLMLFKFIIKKEKRWIQFILFYFSIIASYILSFLLLNSISLSNIIIILGYIAYIFSILNYIAIRIIKPKGLLFLVTPK